MESSPMRRVWGRLFKPLHFWRSCEAKEPLDPFSLPRHCLRSPIGLTRFKRTIPLPRERCQFRFTPDIPCLLYHGDKFTRESIRQKYFSKKQHGDTFPIVVTSYEIVMHDRQYLSRIQWKFIIIDEGHRI